MGERISRKVLDPQEPTKEEREEHEKTHLPYRNWCLDCAKSRGVGVPHVRTSDECKMTEVRMDFCFVGEGGEPHNTQAILVAKEERSKMKLSAAVPSKSTGTYIARRVLGWMKELGIETGDMIMKSDQEAAFTSIVREVGVMRAANGGGNYIIEESSWGQ